MCPAVPMMTDFIAFCRCAPKPLYSHPPNDAIVLLLQRARRVFGLALIVVFLSIPPSTILTAQDNSFGCATIPLWMRRLRFDECGCRVGDAFEHFDCRRGFQ